MAHAQHLAYLIEQARRPRPRQLAKVPAENVAIKKLQGKPCFFPGDERIARRLADLLQEATDVGK
jgi:hypothetical protein